MVGTHQPVGFTARQQLEIAWLASKGFGFHTYNRLNRDNAAGANTVNSKKTQWKRPRVRPAEERARVAALEAGLRGGGADEPELEAARSAGGGAAGVGGAGERARGDADVPAAWAAVENPRVLHCLGVSQRGADMFTDPAARRLFEAAAVPSGPTAACSADDAATPAAAAAAARRGRTFSGQKRTAADESSASSLCSSAAGGGDGGDGEWRRVTASDGE